MPVKKLISDSILTSISDAIRTKLGTSSKYKPKNMATAILSIPTSGITPTGNINITTMNSTDVTNYATAQVVDADIVKENIKSGVNILGVVGEYTGLVPTGNINITDTNTTDVTNYATAKVVDADLIEGNIKSGVNILGVTGNYSGLVPSGNKNITDTSTTDVTNYATAKVVDSDLVAGNIKSGVNILGIDGTYTGLVPSGTYNITTTNTVDVTNYASAKVVDSDLVASNILSGVNILGVIGTHVDPTFTTEEKTVTPTESLQTITPTSADGLSKVTVNAISSTYVGSGITRRTSSDLTASGATVTVPAGYYSSQATKSVASGTAGTPSASKGSVSNHQISITPTVTNTTGYITGGTKTGTAVTVSASELVSGSETKTDNGTYNVTNLATLVVNIPIQKYYTGSTTPSSSLGNNGDLYLKV